MTVMAGLFIFAVAATAILLSFRHVVNKAPIKRRSDDSPQWYKAMEQAGYLPKEWHEGDE